MSNELVDTENTELLIKELAAKAVSGKQTEVWEFLRTLPEERKRFLLVKVRQLLVANSSESDTNGATGNGATNGANHAAKEEPKTEEPKPVANNNTQTTDENDDFGDLDNLGQIDTEIKADIQEEQPKEPPQSKIEPPKEPPKQESPKPIEKDPPKQKSPKEQITNIDNSSNNIENDKGKDDKTEKEIQVEDTAIERMVALSLQSKFNEVEKLFGPLSLEEKEYVRRTIKTALIEADLLQILNGGKKADDLDLKVRKWLENGEPEWLDYVDKFKEHKVKYHILLSFTEDKLEQIGVDKIGVRTSMYQSLKELKEGTKSKSMKTLPTPVGSNTTNRVNFISKIDNAIWGVSNASANKIQSKKSTGISSDKKEKKDKKKK